MYHNPVLLNECLDGLNIRPNGTYVDVTFGGGGHSSEILKRLGKDGKLIGFDQDSDALKNDLPDERFRLVHGNFSFVANHLEYLKALPVEGLLADLGVSSHQFDEASRGFSIRSEGPLDMRMNTAGGESAFEFVNKASKDELTKVLKEYGEVGQAGRVVSAICDKRSKSPIKTTTELVDMLGIMVPIKERNGFLAQIFQAIRIQVNGEMEVLKKLLEQCSTVIKPGGRLVVISYHSLEDRMVKNYIKTGNVEGVEDKDIFGRSNSPFKALSNKPIVPTEKELIENNRSRSAKLRIGIKE